MYFERLRESYMIMGVLMLGDLSDLLYCCEGLWGE